MVVGFSSQRLPSAGGIRAPDLEQTYGQLRNAGSCARTLERRQVERSPARPGSGRRDTEEQQAGIFDDRATASRSVVRRDLAPPQLIEGDERQSLEGTGLVRSTSRDR